MGKPSTSDNHRCSVTMNLMGIPFLQAWWRSDLSSFSGR
jgi:hypothetical protein